MMSRTWIKERISEIQTEVHCRSLMAIDAKRDLLRQMIEGTVPTKVTRKPNGQIEAVYDRLLALQTDAKLAGEFAPEQHVLTNKELSLTFKVWGRTDNLAPKDWIEAEIVTDEPPPIALTETAIPENQYAEPDAEMFEQDISRDIPSLEKLVSTAKTCNYVRQKRRNKPKPDQ